MRIFILLFSLLLSFNLYAQQSTQHTGIGMLGRWQMMNDPDKVLTLGRIQAGPVLNNRQPVSPLAAPTLLSLGSSANIFTSAFGPRTNLFAEPALNTVMMVFRSDPSTVSDPNSGYLRYSYSTNGGTSFSFNSGPLYVPNTSTRAQARYPQCVIYNPPGNTTASASYATFFAPSLTNSANAGWGGHAHGARLLTSGTAVSLQESDSTFLIPDGGALNTSDKTFWVSSGLFNRITGQYIDTILLAQGTWSAGQYQYVYQKIPVPLGIAPDGKKKLEGTSIAWGSGGVGYFAMLCHESFNAVPQLNLYPIIFKTSDNGVTWEKVASLDMNSFGSFFQTASNYTTGFDFDLIVDANNNLHVVTAIGPLGTQPFTISTASGTWGMFDIYTSDGGDNWVAQALGFPKSFRGEWSDATVLFEDNRPQASRSADGTKLFFTWFDTDPAVYSTPFNIFPDVVVTGLNLSTGLWKPEENLTDSSIAAGLCTFGNVSPFTLLNTSTGCHKIPVSFSQLTGSFNDPVEHYYVGGLEVCNSSFTQASNPVSLVNFSNWAGVIIGDSTVCEATTRSYAIDPLIGATQYTWTVPPGSTILTGQGDTTITVRFGPTSGPISVVASDNGFPLGSSITPITVRPVSISATSSNSAICPNGGRSTLTASGGISYSWSPTTGLTTSTGAIVTAAPTTTTTYTVTGTASNGCSRTASVTITALPLPTASISALGPLSFCAGDSVVLKATSTTAISYQWRRNGVNILGQTDTLISVKTTGNYRVVVTNAFGCTAQSSILSASANALPQIGFTAAPGINICTLDSIRLSGTGALQYAWTGGISNGTAFTLNPGTSTFIVTGTDLNGCTNRDTAEITVAAVPQLVVSGTQVICSNDSTTLLASGANTYTWNSGNNTFSGATVVLSPDSTRTFTLTGSNGCTDSIQFTLTVNQLPVVTASPVQASICSGESVNLSTSGATSYLWSESTGLSDSTVSNPVATPQNSITYLVTGTDGNGCTSTATSQITVNPLPQVGYLAIPGNEICGPGNITLSGTGALSYSWSGGITNGQTIAVSSNTSYTVTGTDANGCSQSTTVPLAVNALPVLSITGQTEICAGDSTTLTASGATSYTWSPAIGISTTTGGTVKLSPSSNTTYTVVGFNGCLDSTQFTIVVRQRPTVSGGTNKSVCPGFSATLNASGASTYQWSPSAGLSSTTAASVIATPDSTTTYAVIGTDINGCLDTAQVTVTVKSLPAIGYTASPSNELCGSGTVTLSGTGGTSYTWSGGVTNGIGFSVSSSGTYTVTGTGSNGCTNTATAQISVNSLPIVSIIGNSTLCAGQGTALKASGASTYSWSPSTGLSTTSGDSVFATPASTTTYTVIGNNGCLDTAQITVTVNQLPPVSAGANSNLCLGKSRTLTATGASTYTWLPLAGLSAGTGASVVATPDSSTTYTVVGTDLNGCSKSSSVHITILPLPPLEATINGDSIFCKGGSTTLTASGAVSYLWTPNIGLSSNTSATPTASPFNSTVYTVRGTGSNGCTLTDSVYVGVWQPPVVSGGSNTSICIGGNTSLTASGASSYAWSPGTGLSTTSGPIVNASPISTQTYTLTGTDLNGCVDTALVTVTVNSLPVLSTSGAATICLGSITQLTVSGASTYLWSPGTGLNNTSGSNVSASPVTTTTYGVTGTDVNGCSRTDSLTVYVNPLPVISTRSDTTICSANSIILSATGGVSYTWSPATGLGNTTGNAVQANPVSTTTYIVSGTNLNGCVNRDTVTISVNTSPTITASSNTTICLGDSATITASGAPGLLWSPPTGLSSTIGSPIKASPPSTTIYTVTGTAANGCTRTATTVVSILGLPEVNAGSDTAFCEGSSVVISASGAQSYLWSPSAGLNSSVSATVTASPASTTTYIVRGTDNNGCSNTDTITVTRNLKPIIAAGSDTAFCEGSSVVLNASGGTSYLWSPSAGLSSSTGASVTASPVSSTSYIVRGTDVNGCTNSDTINVTRYSKPTVVATATPNDSVCVGDSITLNGLGALNYQWSQGIVDGTAFSLTANGAYTVTGTDLNGCSNTASISVAAVPVPGAFTIIGDTLVITPQQYTYTVPVGTNEIVTWTVTGGTIVGGQGTSSLVVSWGPASPNSIAATVNNVLGCGSSFVQPVFVTGSVGIAEMGSSAIRLFPNPANDVVWLEFQEAEERTIRLTDLRGRLAGSWTSNAKRIALHPDGTLASGLYQLIINDNQGTTAQLKLVLLR